jgi:hypothetical protein
VLPTAIIAIIVYTIGIPALFAVLLFKNKAKIFSRDLNFGDRYGAAFSVYKRRWFFWELCIFARKFGMILAKIIQNPIFQCIVGILVLFIGIQVQVHFGSLLY